MGHKTKPSLVNRGKSHGGGLADRGEKEEGESKRDLNIQSTCMRFYERAKFINKRVHTVRQTLRT